MYECYFGELIFHSEILRQLLSILDTHVNSELPPILQGLGTVEHDFQGTLILTLNCLNIPSE